MNNKIFATAVKKYQDASITKVDYAENDVMSFAEVRKQIERGLA